MGDTLLNRVVLITGAGRGLGRAYAEEIAKQGARVVICDFYREDNGWVAKHVADRINNSGGEAIWFPTSVTDHDALDYMISAIVTRYGRIDALVHNAGFVNSGSIQSYSVEEWRDSIATHLESAFVLVKKVSPLMIKQQYGRIVLITSTVGMFGQRNSAGYSASKMGIWGLTRSVNCELEEHGILCNAIAPLAVTNKESYTHDDFYNSQYTAQRVAPFVAAFCSEKITSGGMVYQVAGGTLARFEIYESNGAYFEDSEMSIDQIAEKIPLADCMEGAKIIPSLHQAGRVLFKKIYTKKR